MIAEITEGDRHHHLMDIISNPILPKRDTGTIMAEKGSSNRQRSQMLSRNILMTLMVLLLVNLEHNSQATSLVEDQGSNKFPITILRVHETVDTQIILIKLVLAALQEMAKM